MPNGLQPPISLSVPECKGSIAYYVPEGSAGWTGVTLDATHEWLVLYLGPRLDLLPRLNGAPH